MCFICNEILLLVYLCIVLDGNPVIVELSPALSFEVVLTKNFKMEVTLLVKLQTADFCHTFLV